MTTNLLIFDKTIFQVTKNQILLTFKLESSKNFNFPNNNNNKKPKFLLFYSHSKTWIISIMVEFFTYFGPKIN